MAIAKVTREQVRKELYYDKVTGNFYYRFGTKNRPPWRKAGTKNHAGYLTLYAGGQLVYAHQAALLYEKGERAAGHIDHINGDRCDNRIENLRAVCASVNGQNRASANRNSRVPLLGVSRKRGGFRARIQVRRKQINLGVFATPEEAHAAYLEAKRQLHPGNTL